MFLCTVCTVGNIRNSNSVFSNLIAHSTNNHTMILQSNSKYALAEREKVIQSNNLSRPSSVGQGMSLRHVLPLLAVICVWLLLLAYSGVNQSSVLRTRSPPPRGGGDKDEGDAKTRMRGFLAEAEVVWRASKTKKVRALKRLGSSFLKEPWGVHELTVIWDLFAPGFHCPHPVERLGRVGDGGKWVCGFTHLSNRSRGQPCIVYSYGVGSEVSFEREVLERSHCIVHLFDDTISISEGPAADLVWEFPGRVSLQRTGLGVASTNIRRPGDRHSLRTDMALLNESFVDILKVDVEGAEFEALLSILSDFPMRLPWGQLLVEVHMFQLPLPAMVALFAAWLERLESTGLRAFYSEFNQIPSNVGNRSYIDCAEYSFLNIKMPPEYFLR